MYNHAGINKDVCTAWWNYPMCKSGSSCNPARNLVHHALKWKLQYLKKKQTGSHLQTPLSNVQYYHYIIHTSRKTNTDPNSTPQELSPRLFVCLFFKLSSLNIYKRIYCNVHGLHLFICNSENSKPVCQNLDWSAEKFLQTHIS